jgi:hypothetical protein
VSNFSIPAAGQQGPSHEEEYKEYFEGGDDDDQMQFDDPPQMAPAGARADREPAKNTRHRHGHRS